MSFSGMYSVRERQQVQGKTIDRVAMIVTKRRGHLHTLVPTSVMKKV